MPNIVKNSPDTRIRVLVVDDYPIVRNGLKFFLLAHTDLELIGEAANGQQAVQLCRLLRPDVVLMDLLMPMMDGVLATQAIHQCCPHTRIIAFTSNDGETKMAARVLKEGAACCLSKNVSAETLAATIRDVMAQDSPQQIRVTPGKH